MQYRLYDQINTDLLRLSQANDKLESALELVKDNIEKLETDDWQGKSKEAAFSLISILKEYHENLLSIVKEDLNITSSLKDNAEDYMSSGNIPSAWR